MTYCVGLIVDDGLVMVTDSRTNAGVDHISVYRKMQVWEKSGDRVLMLASAGNLAITQATVNRLNEGLTEDRENGNSVETMLTVDSMRGAAQLVGRAVREVHELDADAMKAHGNEFQASFMLGGQIAGGNLRLFLIYAAGNFIEATPETPFFQIGETKYGKPILDRLARHDLSLADSTKMALISMNSTIRSNISVGLPLDLVVVRRDKLAINNHVVIEEGDPYYTDLGRHWSEALTAAFDGLPHVPWQT